MPATSANVTRICWGSTRRARERPKLPSAPIAPPPLAARRASSTNRPTINSVGPNPSSNSTSRDWLVPVDFALIRTPFSRSRFDSWVPFQNVGISVANSVVAVAFLAFGG
jgi:hypothetical protein